MSEHLLDEIRAFGALFELAATHGRSEARDFARRSEQWWLGNAIVEGFLVHVRVLDEFIYGDVIAALRGTAGLIDLRDDVSALDFVADPQPWLDARPDRPEELRRRRISKTVTHLTWARVESGWETEDLSSKHLAYRKEQEWPVLEIWDALRSVLITFLDHVDHGVVCEQFALSAEEALSGQAIYRP